MKKLVSFLMFTVCCGLLTACGVKGPLYFPAEQDQNQQIQTQK